MQLIEGSIFSFLAQIIGPGNRQCEDLKNDLIERFTGDDYKIL